MRESRLGRWLVGGVLAAAAMAFVAPATGTDNWEWQEDPVVGYPMVGQEFFTDGIVVIQEAAADEGREEAVAPANWEWQ